MRLKKIFYALPVVFVGIVSLSSCNRQRDLRTFRTVYQTELANFNYLHQNAAAQNTFTGNMISGLMEGNRIGLHQYALAVSSEQHTVASALYAFNSETGLREVVTSEDERTSLEFTFTLRTKEDGTPLQWVDHNGNERAPIKADDWLAAAEWVLNPNNGSSVLSNWLQLVDGAEAFYSEALHIVRPEQDGVTPAEIATNLRAHMGRVSELVGIRANDNGTVTFRSNGMLPFFTSALSHNAFFPMSRQLIDSTPGGRLGTTFRDIWSNGAYRATAHTNMSRLILDRNEHYWDAENVHIPRIDFLFQTVRTNSQLRELFRGNNIDQFTVNMADSTGVATYITGNDPSNEGTITNPAHPHAFAAVAEGISTSIFSGYFNFERTLSLRDDSIPNMTAAQLQEESRDTTSQNGTGQLDFTTHTLNSLRNTQDALLTTEFRQVFLNAMDWVNFISYRQDMSSNGFDWRHSFFTQQGLAQTKVAGDDAAFRDYTWFVTRQFILSRQAEEGNTQFVDVNANDPEQVEAIRLQMLPTFDSDVDHIFNEERQVATLLKAFETLIDAGVTFPIKIETYSSTSAPIHARLTELLNNASSTERPGIAAQWNQIILEEADEALFIDNDISREGFKFVEFEIVEPADAASSSQMFRGNYDFGFGHLGWGANFADPTAYLVAFAPGGGLSDFMGIRPDSPFVDDLMGSFVEKLDVARGVYDNMEDRFTKMAEAEYHMIFDEALVVPMFQQNPQQVMVSRLVPFSTNRDIPGISGNSFKNRILLKRFVTDEEVRLLRTAWQASVAAQNTSLIDAALQQLTDRITIS